MRLDMINPYIFLAGLFLQRPGQSHLDCFVRSLTPRTSCLMPPPLPVSRLLTTIPEAGSS